jgi:CelD/BcsL family acetyltransferase involved in cellulose biosynthesis
MYTRKTVVWKTTRYKQNCRKNERRLVEMGHVDMLESRERPRDSRNMAKA